MFDFRTGATSAILLRGQSTAWAVDDASTSRGVSEVAGMVSVRSATLVALLHAQAKFAVVHMCECVRLAT